MALIAKGGRLLLGVDLGVSQIRLVEARRTKTGYEPARWAEIAMPPGAYRDGQIVEPLALGSALKEALRSQFKSGTRRAAVAVGGQAALVRRIALPKMKASKLRELMESQGEQWIPFLREGAAFDLAVVDPNLNDKEQEVLLVAVPGRQIDAIRTAIKTAGLRLTVLDVDTNACVRALLALGQASGDGTTAVLAIDQDRMRIGLFQQGFLMMSRNLDTPRSVRPEDSGTLSESLLVDIRRTLETMLAQARGTVTLSGMTAITALPLGDAFLPALERELKTEMGERLEPDFRVTGAGEGGAPPTAAVAFGLALVRTSAPSELMLLPRVSAAERRRRVTAALLSTALLGGTAAYGLAWSRQQPVLQQEKARLERSLNDMNAYLEREAHVAAEEAQAKGVRPVLQQLRRSDPWSVAFPRFKQLLPRGVVISRIAAQPPQLTISGTAPNPDKVAELLQSLADSPWFLDPILVFSDGGKGTVAFQMTVKMATREGVGR